VSEFNYETATGKKVREIESAPFYIGQLAFSPEGEVLHALRHQCFD
jgi:hypothetical protein